MKLQIPLKYSRQFELHAILELAKQTPSMQADGA